jgi:hypothetical protein
MLMQRSQHYRTGASGESTMPCTGLTRWRKGATVAMGTIDNHLDAPPVRPNLADYDETRATFSWTHAQSLREERPGGRVVDSLALRKRGDARFGVPSRRMPEKPRPHAPETPSCWHCGPAGWPQ